MTPARIGIILQARMGSQRLPGKVLAQVGGVSILARCLNRLRLAAVGDVILATTTRPEDDLLEEAARASGFPVTRGSTNDVLDRYVQAARQYQLGMILRATADNPAVDIEAPARVLQALQSSDADYVCEDELPYGAAVEIMTRQALERAAALATAAADREHVTTFIKQHPATFTIPRILAPDALRRPDVRLTVDTPDDLTFVRRVFAGCTDAEPALGAVIAAADRFVRSSVA